MFLFLVQNSLQKYFSETFTLLDIVLTTPVSIPGRCVSSLKQIKAFLRNSMSDRRLNALAVLLIEKSMVSYIGLYLMSMIALLTH